MRIAICDDSREDITRIHQIIHQSRSEETTFFVEKYSDGADLIQALENDVQFDLIFLDVKMKNVDGFKAADYIRSIDRNVMIVFTTSLAHYITKAFRFEASGYLVKPVQAEDVRNVLIRSLKRLRSSESKKMIILETKDWIRRIDPQRVIAVNVEETRKLEYTIFNDDTITIYDKLKNVEDDLYSCGFIKISRSTLVNPYYVRGFDTNRKVVIMCSEIEFAANATKWNEIKKQYAKYIQDSMPQSFDLSE